MPNDELTILPLVFGVAGCIYAVLGGRFLWLAGRGQNVALGYLLLLMGALVGSAGLWYDATVLSLFHVGRTVTILASGLIPVAMYGLYREYAGLPLRMSVFLLLSAVPVATGIFVATNPQHGLAYDIMLVDGIYRYGKLGDNPWFRFVYMPFSYSLFGYSLLALAGRVTSTARGHRAPIVLIVICAVLPFASSVTNVIFGIGPYDYPFTALTMTGLLPLYFWVWSRLARSSFRPIAFHTVFDYVQDAIVVLDESSRIVSANRRAQELLRADENALIGSSLDRRWPETAEPAEGETGGGLHRTVRLDSSCYLDISTAPLLDANGRLRGKIVVCRDITERRKTQKALADSEQLIRSLVEHSPNGILRFRRDPDGFVCVFANRAAERYLDVIETRLVGRRLEELEVLHPALLKAHFENPDNAEFEGRVEAEIELATVGRWLRLLVEPVGADFSATLIDITQSKLAENRMLADALHDSLTGVLNRRGFESLAPPVFDRSAQGAVIYLDLDQFKSINDAHGHDAGDALLRAFSRRLEVCLRPNDLVVRLGGDEFAVVLPGIDAEDARHIAGRVARSAAEHYIIDGKRIRCSASVGIALKPDHGIRLGDLLSLADRAMYNAKNATADVAANDGTAFAEAALES